MEYKWSIHILRQTSVSGLANEKLLVSADTAIIFYDRTQKTCKPTVNYRICSAGRDENRPLSLPPSPVQHHPKESHHRPERIVQTLPELCQTWCCEYFPGEPFPVPTHGLGEKCFPDI